MENAKTALVDIAIIGLSWLTSAFVGVFVPLCIMLICCLIDYITGLMAAKNRGEKITPQKSIEGIFKKVGMIFLIAVGLLLDVLLHVISQHNFGLVFPVESVFAIVLAVWLTLNELISIVANIADIGVKVPFLSGILSKLKKYIGNSLDTVGKEIEKNGNESN